MKLVSDNKGPSEEMLVVTAEVTPQHAFKAVTPALAKDLFAHAARRKQTQPSASEYAVLDVTADLSWRDPAAATRFEPVYTKVVEKYRGKLNADRLKTIYSYRDQIKSGTEFPPPLFIVAGDGMIQVDGAKRMLAAALAGQKAVKVQIFVKRAEIKKFIEPEFIEQIKTLHEVKKWFGNYQEIIELGLPGKRAYAGRFPAIVNLARTRGKVVAEFGCSNGQALFEAYYSGAKEVYGFEYVQENVDIINALAARLGVPVKAYQLDLNDPEWLAKAKAIVPGWDYSMYFSVYRTKELLDPAGIVRNIWAGTRRGLFFEGHGAAIDTDAFYRDVFVHKAKLDNCDIYTLSKGIIEKPKDTRYRLKYLLMRKGVK